ncbi:MAG: cellulase family glycosylhydrolase, partial [Melioribacteraceae bacterium]
MKKIFFAAIFVIALIFEGCSAMPINEPKFVRVNGTHFTIDGNPYYFAGTNLWYGCYLGAARGTGDRERLLRELDGLKDLGITNLRIMASSEDSYMKKTLRPVIQPAPGEYNEVLLEGLDFLLAEMGRREMHAVIFLNNYWEWSGGFASYNRWFGDGRIVDPYDSLQTWGDFMNFSAEFYRNEKANEHFKKFIFKIVTSKNRFTGKNYFEDPTIMSWQLANEPRPGWGDDALQYVEHYYRWIDETAAYIHSIDPNHLVSTGSEGVIGSLQSEEIFLKAHQSRNIDYVTFHLWIKNWGWFDPLKPEETYPSAEKNAVDYINQNIEVARKLNKPVTMEEFGLGRDSDNCEAGTASSIRDKYFRKIFSLIYESAASGLPVAGLNFWAWGGEGRGKNEDDVWRSGDPFVGDPPHEPQGVYSIFDTDYTTLEIIREEAAR